MKRCTSDEIADALRGEIECGRWKAGEALPSCNDLCSRFCAGEWAVRHALRSLRDRGYVSICQNRGVTVSQKMLRAWKGRIAFVTLDETASYFPCRLWQSLSRRFGEDGWECPAVFAPFVRKGEYDLSRLERLISNGLDFAVVLADSKKALELLELSSVPYVVLNGYTHNYPNARGVVREDFRECYKDLIRVMRERRVKTILEVDGDRVIDRSFKSLIAEAGFSMRRIICKGDADSPWSLQDVRSWGYRGVSDFLKAGRNGVNPPDVILFDDDYLAQGGLVALYEAGLRVPKDVKVVFYSNRGNAPVLGFSAARVENDPIKYGESVAEYVLKLLDGRRAAPPKISWRFIPGESL